MRGKLAVAGALGAAAFGVYWVNKKPEPLKTGYSEAATKVLVVGGGFGGLAAAEELVRELGETPDGRDVGVAVLDRQNYTTFWPMVPSAISGDIEVRHAAHAIRRITRPLGVEFFEAEVAGADFEARKLNTEVGDFSYDYLVLAPGSRTTFFGTPGAEEHAMDLKGLRDALRVRNHVIDCFEEAQRRRNNAGYGSKSEAEDGLLTFVFVGGGPTGVEGIADTHDLIFDVLKQDYPKVDFDEVRLILVNSGDHILKGIDQSLANAARRRLEAQKVEITNNTKAKEVLPDAITLSDGREIPARTVVWAAGIEPPPLVGELNLAKDKRGRIVVDENLHAKGRPDVYAVGDSVCIDYDGPPVPALAQAAEQEGKTAARNVVAEIRGDSLTPFRYEQLGQLVDLGTGSALIDIFGVRFSGFLGALVWRGVYLRELGHNLNRAQVLVDWATDIFARPDTSKLFED